MKYSPHRLESPVPYLPPPYLPDWLPLATFSSLQLSRVVVILALDLCVLHLDARFPQGCAVTFPGHTLRGCFDL